MLDSSLRWYPLETGGVLMGYAIGPEITIAEIIGPGPGADHLTVRFDPDGQWHEDEIARIHGASSGRVTYLGDWHSHPRGKALPSHLDKATAKHIAETPESGTRTPLMLIVGMTEDAKFALRAYQWDGRHLKQRATRVSTDTVPGNQPA